MSGCQLLSPKQIEVTTQSINYSPSILDKPIPPTLSKEQIIGLTSRDAEYYSEACIALSEAEEGEDVGYVGLDIESACEWSVMAFTVQGWLNFQQNLILIEFYVKQLESQRDFYEKQLLDIKDISSKEVE